MLLIGLHSALPPALRYHIILHVAKHSQALVSSGKEPSLGFLPVAGVGDSSTACCELPQGLSQHLFLGFYDSAHKDDSSHF